jgi:hypothetical protein
MMNNMTGMGNAYAMGGGSGGTELKVSFVKYEDSDKYPEWAQGMEPYRMVIVTGAFPLKQEMETFRQALRFPEVGKMLDQADFEFSGLTVERREAKTVEELQKKDWHPLDVETNLKVVMMKAVGKEPDDPKLKSAGLILDPNRIFMPLPKLETELHKDNKYPDDLLPSSIQDTLTALEKAGGPAVTSKKRQSRFKGGDYNLWEEDEGPGGQAEPGPGSGYPGPRQNHFQRAGRAGEMPAALRGRGRPAGNGLRVSGQGAHGQSQLPQAGKGRDEEHYRRCANHRSGMDGHSAEGKNPRRAAFLRRRR